MQTGFFDSQGLLYPFYKHNPVWNVVKTQPPLRGYGQKPNLHSFVSQQSGACVFRCAASVAHLFIFGGSFMKQTINDLKCGRICAKDRYAEELLIEQEMKKFFDLYRKDVIDKLEPDERQGFLDFINALDKICAEACDEAFEKGFSLGVRITSEAFM